MIWSLGWEDLLEKEMATYSSNLAWRIPWTEEPNRLQSMGSQKVGHNWTTNTFTTYKVLWCVLTISCPLCSSQRKVPSCHSRVLNMWFPLISSLPLLPVYSYLFPQFPPHVFLTLGLLLWHIVPPRWDGLWAFLASYTYPALVYFPMLAIACLLVSGDLAKNNLAKSIWANWTIYLK